MKKLHVAFVWHMHQPLYKDYLTNRYYLPWVRLHALKGYYDMPAMVRNVPGMKATFNLTPSLLAQLQDYCCDENINDDFYALTRKPAELLTRDEKEFMLMNFFMNNWETIIKPHPRYGELLRKRGLHYTARDAGQVMQRFERQDFLDLQVLFNLSWFGYAFRAGEPDLNALIHKQRDYTEDEKQRVLAFQWKAMRSIVPLYRDMQERGQIEISTTPFYHPILPLLDSGVSYYGYNWHADVTWHIQAACGLYEKTFGVRPRGFWPSEGSVSRSIVQPFIDAGVEWLATDEEILLQSVGGGNRTERIYRGYSVPSANGRIGFYFRDKKLSDLIGFSYANADPELAANDFINQLHGIRESVAGLPGEHIVAIILDGENAWEYYRDGGERFLSLLYERIVSDTRFEPITPGEYGRRYGPGEEIHTLYAGSWINHNFDIWYGHEEDRRGWDYLAKTRDYLMRQSLVPEQSNQAWQEIYAAEGSDWFWWFGDEFTTTSEGTFDFLFRNHLMNVYRLTGTAIPDYLQIPIKKRAQAPVSQEPVGFINPRIDGTITMFYEWTHAGIYTLDDALGAMQAAEKSVDTIYYGFNLDTLFFRVDLDRAVSRERLMDARGRFEIVTDTAVFCLEFGLHPDTGLELRRRQENGSVRVDSFTGRIAFDRIFELACPFAELGLKAGEGLKFSFLILRNDIAVEQWPKFNTIAMQVPGPDFEDTVWSA